MSHVRCWLGLQVLVQSIQWVVLSAARYAGQVVHLPAPRAHATGLLDDPRLLHATQQLQPLHGQDAVIGAGPEHGEDMQFQRAYHPDGRALGPGALFGGMPLACKMLEGVAAGFILDSSAGLLLGYGVAALGYVPADLVGLSASLLSGQLMSALAIRAQAYP